MIVTTSSTRIKWTLVPLLMYVVVIVTWLFGAGAVAAGVTMESDVVVEAVGPGVGSAGDTDVVLFAFGDGVAED